MSVKLTSEEFWDHFWSNLKIPVRLDLNFKNDRVISDEILAQVKISKLNKVAVEIGCAPGKWMVFASEKLGCEVYGVEYLPRAAEVTRLNLIECGIDGHVEIADFFSYNPEKKFDLVMSFGFIEHFENYEDVFLRHLDLVIDGGYLVLGLPRFRGINYFVQRLIDPSMERPYLKSHVLSLMNLKIFNELADKYKLKKISIKYIGGFEPALFPIGEIKNKYLKFIVRVIVKLSSIFFGKFNSSFTSSYQIIILQKTL